MYTDPAISAQDRPFTEAQRNKVAQYFSRQIVGRGLIECSDCREPITDLDSLKRTGEILCSRCRGLDLSLSTPPPRTTAVTLDGAPSVVPRVSSARRSRFGSGEGEIPSSRIVTELARDRGRELRGMRGQVAAVVLGAALLGALAFNAWADSPLAQFR